jgi:hypothetical protein
MISAARRRHHPAAVFDLLALRTPNFSDDRRTRQAARASLVNPDCTYSPHWDHPGQHQPAGRA